MTPAVRVGDLAPDFELPAGAGETVRLSEVRRRAAVVLYFYPHDFTPVCTREACSFRDEFADFQAAGAEVLGVSSDTVESHQRFAARHNLPFRLLSDTDQRVRRLYGVPATLGVLPGRATYVIDRDGIVRHMYAARLRGARHVQEALRTVRAIAGPKKA